LSSLSIVIPSYNEEKRLPPSLERIAEYLGVAGIESVEVLVVNDGSRDRTFEVAQQASELFNQIGVAYRVLENPGNRGKGYSVRHGMREARHDWVLFTDADLSAPIEEAAKLLEAVKTAEYSVAIGSRALDRSLIGVHQPLFRELSGRVFNLVVRIFTGLALADTQCGFKLFSKQAARDIASRQQLERFGFDVEQLFLAKKMGHKIAEVAVRWNDVEGTTVGTLDGISAFADVWKVRWNDLTGRYS
jgi:dolichyl-phosphate beta-glucosyltransferase